MTTPVPTAQLALLMAVSAFLAIPLQLSGPLAVSLILTGVGLLAVVDYALAPSPRGLEIERDHAEVIGLGSSGVLTWTVRNRTTKRVVVDLADQLSPSLLEGERRCRLVVRSHGRAQATTLLRPSRRGTFRLERVTVRTYGPVALVARQRAMKVESTIRVYPPFRSKDEAELRINKARMLEVGLRSAQGRGGGTEFDQLREYTVDDEFRRIDWAATARNQKPIVRTYRAERNQTVISLLDNGRVMAGTVAGVPRVEWAMDAVMMLTAVATRLGDRAGLVAFDQRIRAIVPPGHGRQQLNVITSAMYDLEPELAESDYRGAFLHTLARFRRRTMLVIYSDLVEQAVGENLLPALPLILRHHLIVVAAVRDPQVERWRSSSPSDSEGVYRQASAVRTIEDRRRTAARLRGLGVTVIDEPPGQMAPALADAYLRVKATGRL